MVTLSAVRENPLSFGGRAVKEAAGDKLKLVGLPLNDKKSVFIKDKGTKVNPVFAAKAPVNNVPVSRCYFNLECPDLFPVFSNVEIMITDFPDLSCLS